MSDKRAAKASRAALLQTKELQELQELPLQSQKSCQHKNFLPQKIKTLKPKHKKRERERERAKKLDNKWTRVNRWKGSRASSRASVCKLLQREEGGKGELVVRKHELQEGS